MIRRVQHNSDLLVELDTDCVKTAYFELLLAVIQRNDIGRKYIYIYIYIYIGL